MLKAIVVGGVMLFATSLAFGEEPEQEATDPEQTESPAEEVRDQTKTMSGMSILGNEEAPKSLVIIPWRSSELGEDPMLSNLLDDRARPVDKEVFLRELRFYEIRADQ